MGTLVHVHPLGTLPGSLLVVSLNPKVFEEKKSPLGLQGLWVVFFILRKEQQCLPRTFLLRAGGDQSVLSGRRPWCAGGWCRGVVSKIWSGYRVPTQVLKSLKMS